MNTTILLVDDETMFVHTMTNLLTRQGCTVLQAFDGGQALTRLAENDGVDVVVLDVKMPGLDGIETLKKIRKEYPLVEVILLTGHATVESAIDGMHEGAFEYLMKPCDLDKLTNIIARARDRKAESEEKNIQARTGRIISRVSWD